MRNRVISAYRLLLALLTATALAYEAHADAARPGGLIDFFSYFTMASNILGVLVLSWGGIADLTGLLPAPDHLRGALVVYLVITGTVYALLLADLNPGQTAWTNTAMHQIMPAAIVLDWLIAPPRTRLSLPKALTWLIFPVAYLTYTLVRGARTNWYPYPFLTPDHGDYTAVAQACAVIAAGFVLVIIAVTWSGNTLRRRLSRRLTLTPTSTL